MRISCITCGNCRTFNAADLPFVNETFGYCLKYDQIVDPEAFQIWWETSELECWKPKKEEDSLYFLL